MSEQARRLLDLTVEYAQRVQAEDSPEFWPGSERRGTPTGRSLDEIAADYDAALRGVTGTG